MITEKERELFDLVKNLPCESGEPMSCEDINTRVIIGIYAHEKGLTEEFIETIKSMDKPTLEQVDKRLLGDFSPFELFCAE